MSKKLMTPKVMAEIKDVSQEAVAQHAKLVAGQPSIQTVKRNLNMKYAGRIVKFKDSGKEYQMQGDGSIRRLDGQRRRKKRTMGGEPRDTRSERQKRREAKVGRGK